MKIDEYDPGDHADEQGERELLERDRAEQTRRRSPAARSPAGSATRLVLQRAHQHLVHRDVDDVARTASAPPRSGPVFSWTLSNTTIGVVQRVAEDGEERDDRGRRDLELEHRVDADADEHVVDHRRRCAASAIRHSKRNEMNRATSARNTTSARIAFSVISRPHVELTNETLTSAGSTPAASANAAVHLVGRLARQFLDLHGDDVGALGTADLDACAVGRTPLSSRTARGVVDAEGLARRDVPRHAALEVEAEVEALRDQRHDRDDDHDGAIPRPSRRRP